MENNQRLILLGIGAFLVVGFIVQRTVAATVEAVTEVNVGTPFEGTGIVGTVGNITNQLSGGLFAQLGGAIGRGLFSIFGDKVDDFDELDQIPGGG